MWLFLSLACKPTTTPAPPDVDGSPTGTEPDPDSTAPTVPDETAETGSTAHTGPTSTLQTFDCATIPVEPPPFREVEGPRGYHDLAFLADGTVLGNMVNGSDLGLGDAYGGFALAIPNTGTIEQMAWLPDGDLAAASLERGILRISLSGSITTINPNIRPYGLVVGPDDRLWAADQSRIWAVDPATGVEEEILARGALDRGGPRVIAFDLDDTHLYIGTLGGSQGRIYRLPLGPDFRPTGPPEVFASGVGIGGYHDAIGVDLCGYLYVPDYDSANLYRIDPSGAPVQILINAGFLRADYPHGLEWGLGVGGFRSDALYMPQPYDANRVMELIIGAPPKGAAGYEAINLP